jgi:RHS repeat-associated protein
MAAITPSSPSYNPSPWTNGTDYFMTPGNRVQDLTYTYDADGNITHLVDSSFTKTAKTVDYTYDDLNRLTQASTTPDVASGAPNSGHSTREAWAYDILGNILTDATTTGTTTATTTYTYAGSSGSNYANPDAATQWGSAALGYDKNGNATTGPSGFQGAWDWRNRLSISTSTAQTTNYAYDENDKRARVSTPSGIIHYVNDLFSSDRTSGNPTKHLFVNGHEIATVDSATGSGVVDYAFTDNLGSVNVSANSSNRVQEITDYTPYGTMNNHDQLAGFTELRKYTDKPFDTDTGLEYYNARYYNPTQGQFLSEDPSFLTIDAKSPDLGDPQKLNSYSYALNNPLRYTDPDGKQVALAALLGIGVIAFTAEMMFAPAQTQQMLQALDPGTFRTGTLQDGGPRFMQLQPSNPEEPPRGDGPNWKNWAYGISMAVLAADTVRESHSGIKDTIGDWKRKVGNLFNLGVDNKGSVTISTGSPSGSYISSGSSYLSNLQYPISNNVFASSPQTRYQAVQRYNSSSGASSNENKLWVTPGGAVITWSGGVIAPAPSQKR